MSTHDSCINDLLKVISKNTPLPFDDVEWIFKKLNSIDSVLFVISESFKKNRSVRVIVNKMIANRVALILDRGGNAG